MPMKMEPMKPAMPKSMIGSASATAVLSWRSRAISVTPAMRTSSYIEPAALLRHGDHLQRRAAEERAAICQAGGEWFAAFLTRSVESVTRSISVRLPRERRATYSALMSDTPALSSVPSMRQKRAMRKLRSERPDDRHAQQSTTPSSADWLRAPASFGRNQIAAPITARGGKCRSVGRYCSPRR